MFRKMREMASSAAREVHSLARGEADADAEVSYGDMVKNLGAAPVGWLQKLQQKFEHHETAPMLGHTQASHARYGPWVRLRNYDAQTKQWSASVLAVTPPGDDTPPVVRVLDEVQGEYDVSPIHLDTYNSWGFWRYDINTTLSASERTMAYVVDDLRYEICLPGAEQQWRWGFYSCNGFHEVKMELEAGGITALWKDAMNNHRKAPFHLMVGGGDQLYCDYVWECPSLVQWCKIDREQNPREHPFSDEMFNEVNDYYFHAYLKHWGQAEFKDALACIPQIMTWDDHDTFDGWGSYPEALHNCPVFQGVFKAAQRFYALFQQHTTPDRAFQDNGFFGEAGWNMLTAAGPNLALMVLDSRSERTLQHIIRDNTWDMIKDRLNALPECVKHVVVVAAVPLIYPEIPATTQTLGFLGDAYSKQAIVAQLFQKTGLSTALMNQFGTVDLLDDINDHWGAAIHHDERLAVTRMMQDIAQAKNIRFTLLSGDVHLAAVGRFVSNDEHNLQADHRYIPQVISSAIGNMPPPAGVVQALTKCSGPKQFDADTKEQMLTEVFGSRPLCPQRNWLKIRQNPATDGMDGALTFQFRVEPLREPGTPPPDEITPQIYTFSVPMLNSVHHW